MHWDRRGEEGICRVCGALDRVFSTCTMNTILEFGVRQRGLDSSLGYIYRCAYENGACTREGLRATPCRDAALFPNRIIFGGGCLRCAGGGGEIVRYGFDEAGWVYGPAEL